MAVLWAVLGGSQWATAAVVQSVENQGIVYFLADSPARVERYQLAGQQWLAPVTLPTTHGNPTVLAIDADGIYVAYGKGTYRYAVDGTNEISLANISRDVVALHTAGNVIYINSSDIRGYVKSINKTTNLPIAESEDLSNALRGSSIVPSVHQIFGRSLGVGPSDITYVNYTEDGEIGYGGNSRYHGNYPDATKTYLYPNQDKIIDNSGTIYTTADLTYAGSLAGAFDDLAFNENDALVVVRGTELTAYAANFLPTGSKILPQAPYKIAVDGSDVITFSPDSQTPHGLTTTIVPLSDLKATVAAPAVDPDNLSFTPDTTFLGNDGLLYLFSKANRCVFRWDPAAQRYGRTIPLIDVPSFIAYNSALNRIYLAYPTGAVRKIDLSAEDPLEQPFWNAPNVPVGISNAGDYLFVIHRGLFQVTIDPFGAQVDIVSYNSASTEYIWSEVAQKMYYFRDGISPNDIYWREINANGSTYASEPPGGLGKDKESPLHSSEGFLHPIRVSPDGSKVVLGSGRVHDGLSLERSLQYLVNQVADMAWIDNADLRTIRNFGSGTQYQQWTGPTYVPKLTKQYPGTAHSLIGINSTRLLGVSIPADGRPSFYLLDQNFEIVSPANLAKPTMLAVGALSAAEVLLTWADVSGEKAYRIERKNLSGGNWIHVGTTGPSETKFIDKTAPIDFDYAYRVTATSGSLASAPSDEIVVSLALPRQPEGLSGVAASPYSVNLTWQDVRSDAGYQIVRAPRVSGPWTLAAVAVTDASSALINNLSPGATYYFRIVAVNVFGSSPYSSIVSVTIPKTLLGAPEFYDSKLNPGCITLFWYNAEGEEQFVLERRASGGSAWTVLATLPMDMQVFSDVSVTAGTTYDYRVKAVNSAGASGYSQIRSLKASAAPVLLPPPVTIVARPTSSSTNFVYWGEAPGANSYRLESSLDLMNWTVMATATNGATYYYDTGLVANKIYYYRVQSMSVAGSSGFGPDTYARTLRKVEDWRIANFGSSSTSGVAAAQATGVDGVSNFMKFASNQRPEESGTLLEADGTKGTPRVSVNPENNRLRVTFVRYRAAMNPGIVYEVQFSNGVGSWAAGGTAVEITQIDAEWERVVWEDTVSIFDSPRRFARVKVMGVW